MNEARPEHNATAKTRTELLESRKKEFIKDASKGGRQTSPKSNFARRSLMINGENVRNILPFPPDDSSRFEGSSVPFTYLREGGMTKNQSSVNPRNSPTKTTTEKRRSPMVLKREQQKYLPDHPNRSKVSGVDSGGNSTSFGQTSLAEVKYWYYMFNERSGLDDPSVPLYSSFSSDFKFGSIKEKVMNRAAAAATAGSTTTVGGYQQHKFNPDQHFINPKHKRKTTFSSTLLSSPGSPTNSVLNNAENVEPFKDAQQRTTVSRQSYTSNSSSVNIPSTTSPSRPSSASISLRKKAVSVTLPARPMSARVAKSTNNNFVSISASNTAAIQERVDYHSPEPTASCSDLDEISSNISQVSKIENLPPTHKSSSPFHTNNFNSPPIPLNKSITPSTTSSNTRKELTNTTARPVSARLSSRSEFSPPPPPDVTSSPSLSTTTKRVDMNSTLRARPQSSFNPNPNKFTAFPSRPHSASVLT